MENKSVGIVILNWNNSDDTIECLESLNSCLYLNKHIVIVDNSSSDNSVDNIKNYLQSHLSDTAKSNHKEEPKFFISDVELIGNEKNINYEYYEVILIKNNVNSGYGRGNNVGLCFCQRYLKCHYLWVLNNDVIVDKNCINELVDYSERVINDKGFIGATVLEYYNREIIQYACGGYYNKFLTITKPSGRGKNIKELKNIVPKFNYISGCSIFSAADNFLKINNFSEDYFLYFEEIDLYEKSKLNDINIFWCKNAFIYHKEGNTIGSKSIVNSKSKVSEYYSNISCLIYTKKWHKLIYPFVFVLRFSLKYIKYILEGNKELLSSLIKSYNDYISMKKC